MRLVGAGPGGRRTAAEHLAELERLGLLETATFRATRDRTERYAIDILCGGRVLEPEALGPPFSSKAWAAQQVPEDGQVIASVGYDELKRTHT